MALHVTLAVGFLFCAFATLRKPSLVKLQIMGSVPEDIKLAVGIIGAGIAGLGAAIALRKAGHNVEVSPVGSPIVL